MNIVKINRRSQYSTKHANALSFLQCLNNTACLFAVCVALCVLSACGQKNSATEHNTLKAYNQQENLLNKPINIINLWASWCEPCRKEIPELSACATQHPEVGVIGIALDSRQNVEKFLQTTPITYSIRYHDKDATAVFLRFGNNTGGIPYTVIDAPQCGFRQPYFGVISTQQLAESIAKAQKQCHYP